VLIQDVRIECTHAHGNELQPLLFEALNDRSDEPALHGIGFDEDEGLGGGHGAGPWEDGREAQPRWRPVYTDP
jgi:hypothetical protein